MLAVAGSAFYRGAALLAAEGALRTGAGIVTLASVEPVLQRRRPPAGVLPVPLRSGGRRRHLAGEYRPLRRQKATVLLVGPGLGGTAQSAARAAETRALVQKLLPGFSGSAVLDADGLNAAAQLLQRAKSFPPGGRTDFNAPPRRDGPADRAFAAEINADREGTAALRYAKAWNAVVVLKGARTVIAGPDGRVCGQSHRQPGAFPGRQRGCTGGDACGAAGLRSARLEAAACAVYLHGAAADRAAAKRGEYGMLPHDILPELGTLFAEKQR